MALPAIPDELLVDIFLRLPTPEDLVRASAAFVSFRRLIADRSFVRRFRKLHPPPLLGFVDYRGFHPAVPPHPSAPAASAVASAADFDFEFLPGPSLGWSVREVRDGRVLLDRPCRHDELGPLFKEMVVCDPLHRQYLLLPPIPDDLAAPVVCQILIEEDCFADYFLVPSGDDQEAEATSFRVFWLVLLQTKRVVLVFSSDTGQWRAITSLITWSLPGFDLYTWTLFPSRHYAHGCFYWVSGLSEKLLVLDIRRMEFSMADHPPCVKVLRNDLAIVEAGQGVTVMFVPKPDTPRRIYTVWRNNGWSSTQWQMENETFSLDPGSFIIGSVGRHLLLYYGICSSVKTGCYTQDVDTFQLERVCVSCPHPSEVYCNFPPSLLSSPTVSSVPRHTDHRGVDDAVPAPEPRQSDPGGVEGATGPEPMDLARELPCKRRRRSGRSGSRTRGGGSRWTGRRRLRLDPWWMRAWGRMRGQIKLLSRTAATKSLGARQGLALTRMCGIGVTRSFL